MMLEWHAGSSTPGRGRQCSGGPKLPLDRSAPIPPRGSASGSAQFFAERFSPAWTF
jgi:hypothetical protein